MSYRDNKDVFNFKLTQNIHFTKAGLPIVRGIDYIPHKVLPFNYALTTENKDNTIHFYIDDYQFERIWNSPIKYTKILKKFSCLIGPDFSMYKNFPKPLQMFNLYKQRLLTAYWQSLDIKVIPNVCWSNFDDLETCLDGLPKYSVIALSTNGCLNKQCKNDFVKCFNKMKEILKPLKILVVGKLPEEIKYTQEIIQYDSFANRFENMKKGDKM